MNRFGTITLWVAGGAFAHYLAANGFASVHGKQGNVPSPPKSAVAVAISSTAGMQFDTVLGTPVKATPLDLRRFEILG